MSLHQKEQRCRILQSKTRFISLPSPCKYLSHCTRSVVSTMHKNQDGAS
uniref:Uncharacterized protein n=1 Tax=Arundo donax TaxID=35708 RepID=A0A0A9BHC1_ARUDO